MFIITYKLYKHINYINIEKYIKQREKPIWIPSNYSNAKLWRQKLSIMKSLCIKIAAIFENLMIFLNTNCIILLWDKNNSILGNEMAKMTNLKISSTWCS